MAERKVLNKYYPPTFDPAALVRTTKPKNNQVTVRLMLPMSIQCVNCGEYIHKGKKFNGRKEESVGENYLGIKVWRFYLKCTTCLSEITFKTDPKRNDYTVERGASRNFEPWKQKNVEEELEKAKKEREEMGDSMKVRRHTHSLPAPMAAAPDGHRCCPAAVAMRCPFAACFEW